MTCRALIIDDDPGIVEEVTDILESLGHASESAACMQSARERLATGRYDCILLDLEIPVRAGRNIARIQNGINLLKEIRRTHSTPIIVITGHGNDGPDQAVEAMRAGANDYIAKPFNLSRRPFDDVICGILPANHAAVTHRPAQTRRFEGGEVVFFPDRVELHGVKVCGGPECGIMRTILDTLCERRPDGCYKAFSGAELTRRAGADRGQNAAAEAIRGFRLKVQQLLLDELNMDGGLCDVIENDRRHGYRFSEKIAVRDHDDPANGAVRPAHDPVNSDDPVFRPEIQGHDTAPRLVPPDDPVFQSEIQAHQTGPRLVSDDPVFRPEMRGHGPSPRVAPDDPVYSRGLRGHAAVGEAHGPVNEPVRAGDDPVNDTDDPANQRRNWIRHQLAAGRPLRREDLQKQFGVSTTTAKRDFQALKDAGEVEFVGPAKTGFYHLTRRRR